MTADEETVTMRTELRHLRRVDKLVVEVFSRAGMTTVERLREFVYGDDDELIAKAIADMRAESIHGARYWNNLRTRCYNLLIKIRDNLRVEDDVPRTCRCPIGMDWFQDPVIVPSGASYSRLEIEEHIRNDPRDPQTRQPLTADMLVANRALADLVQEHRMLHERFRVAADF